MEVVKPEHDHPHAQKQRALCLRCGEMVDLVVANPNGDRRQLKIVEHPRPLKPGEVKQEMCR